MIRQHETPRPIRPEAPAARSVARRSPNPGLELLRLQRAYGNRHVQLLVRPPSVARPPAGRSELVVGRVDDSHEHAADRAAELATSPHTPERTASGLRPGSPRGSGGSPLPAVIARGITRLGGGGRRLPPDLRARMEGAYRTAFDHVRVHTDARAHGLSDAMGARAFTLGRDVFFSRGGYRPDTAAGRLLIAHELAHVVQQRGAATTVQRTALVADKLNVVGEYHDESERRRPEEKAFARDVTGSANYWTESEFVEPVTTEPADRMEYRAAHAAAMLIHRSDLVWRLARKLVAKEQGFDRANLDRLVEDLGESVRGLRQKWVAPAGGRAQQPIFDVVDAIFRAAGDAVDEYRESIASSWSTFVKFVKFGKLGTVKELARRLQSLDDRLTPLVEAADPTWVGDRAEDFGNRLSELRSAAMADAASATKQLGVWKVGDEHVTDLRGGVGRLDAGRVNTVNQGEFNRDLVSWKDTCDIAWQKFRSTVRRLQRWLGPRAAEEPVGEREVVDVASAAQTILEMGWIPLREEKQRDWLRQAAVAVRQAGYEAAEGEKAELLRLADDLERRAGEDGEHREVGSASLE